MSTVLAVIGMVVFPLLSVLFVWYPWSITNANWYGHYTEKLYLYQFPPGLHALWRRLLDGSI